MRRDRWRLRRFANQQPFRVSAVDAAILHPDDHSIDETRRFALIENWVFPGSGVKARCYQQLRTREGTGFLPYHGQTRSQLLLTGVAVEKLHFRQNTENLGDRKCLGKPRTSFLGHPDAILFLRISRERVFQQPQAISLIEGRGIPGPGQ
jgi:hypothetical protein